MKQAILLENILDFSNQSRPRSKKIKKKQDTIDNINSLYEGGEKIINAFRSGIIPKNETKGKGLEQRTPK